MISSKCNNFLSSVHSRIKNKVFFQVVSLALYVYFIAALLGRQFVPYADPSIYKSGTKWEVPDMYFPFFTSLQVRSYFSLTKVSMNVVHEQT